MTYGLAKLYLQRIELFEENLKKIDIAKADLKRDGKYTIAIEQLKALKSSDIDFEDIFGDPDNTLRNIIMLAHLDCKDHSTRK